MGKLWDKGSEIDALFEEFTVGNDYILDLNLVPADCAASIAHSDMLASIGILKEEEAAQLRKGLLKILGDWKEGLFRIERSEEDCHTALENRLRQYAGEAGKKIHTGRSRNDQVLAALRLYGREGLLYFARETAALASDFCSFAEEYKLIPLPGRTHMQPAMPSSVGLWAASFAEDLLEGLEFVKTAYRINNRCPLGSAASYGVPLPLNRELVSDLLGFEEPHHNVLSANNSRGRIELLVLEAMEYILLIISKAAEDLLIFSLPEFGYFSLPESLCTGSSIMPQKKNPDGLELLRAKSATLSSYADRIRQIIRALPSGYNRDFQETKEPFIKGLDLGILSVRIMRKTIQGLKPDVQRLLSGFTPEIFATDAALEAVEKGSSFRDVYREIGTALSELSARDPVGALVKRRYTGTTGNLELDKVREGCGTWERWIGLEELRVRKRIADFLGMEIPLFCRDHNKTIGQG